jgi:hypothetical protein
MRAKLHIMLADPLILILLGIGLILVVAIGIRPKIKTGSFRGNIIGGNVRGTATQTYAPREVAEPEKDGGIAARDVIGWLITLLGVAIAAAGLYLKHSAG